MIIVHFWLHLDSIFLHRIISHLLSKSVLCSNAGENRYPGALHARLHTILIELKPLLIDSEGLDAEAEKWVRGIKYLIVKFADPMKVFQMIEVFQGLLRCVVNQAWFRQIWLIVIFRMSVRSPGTKGSVPHCEGLWRWLQPWTGLELSSASPGHLLH